MSLILQEFNSNEDSFRFPSSSPPSLSETDWLQYLPFNPVEPKSDINSFSSSALFIHIREDYENAKTAVDKSTVSASFTTSLNINKIEEKEGIQRSNMTLIISSDNRYIRVPNGRLALIGSSNNRGDYAIQMIKLTEEAPGGQTTISRKYVAQHRDDTLHLNAIETEAIQKLEAHPREKRTLKPMGTDNTLPAAFILNANSSTVIPSDKANSSILGATCNENQDGLSAECFAYIDKRNSTADQERLESSNDSLDLNSSDEEDLLIVPIQNSYGTMIPADKGDDVKEKKEVKDNEEDEVEAQCTPMLGRTHDNRYIRVPSGHSRGHLAQIGSCNERGNYTEQMIKLPGEAPGGQTTISSSKHIVQHRDDTLHLNAIETEAIQKLEAHPRKKRTLDPKGIDNPTSSNVIKRNSDDAESNIEKVVRKRVKCEHGRRKEHCRECGGSDFCVHGRTKAHCRECGGSYFCVHGRKQNHCKECGGSSFCVHGRTKERCKECGGSSFCVHGIGKFRCRECGGSSFCVHGKRKSRCKECTSGDHGV